MKAKYKDVKLDIKNAKCVEKWSSKLEFFTSISYLFCFFSCLFNQSQVDCCHQNMVATKEKCPMD